MTVSQVYLAAPDFIINTFVCTIVVYEPCISQPSRDSCGSPDPFSFVCDRSRSFTFSQNYSGAVEHSISTVRHPSSFRIYSMPGPGARRHKPKPKKPAPPPFVSLADNPITTFAVDIDHEEGWHIIVNILCKHLQLPGMLRVLASLSRVVD